MCKLNKTYNFENKYYDKLEKNIYKIESEW